MKPQARKVLRHLRDAGAGGVHSRQLRADFIADPPTRVCELRALGFDISREKEGNGTRYVLRAERGAGLPARAATPASPSPGPRAGAVPLLPGGGGSHSPAPAAPLPGSVTLERKRTSKGHEYAHQPPDGRPDWVLVLDYSDPERPDFRWERRAPAQMEAA